MRKVHFIPGKKFPNQEALLRAVDAFCAFFTVCVQEFPEEAKKVLDLIYTHAAEHIDFTPFNEKLKEIERLRREHEKNTQQEAH